MATKEDHALTETEVLRFENTRLKDCARVNAE